MTLDEFLIFEKENDCGTLHVEGFYYWWYLRWDLIEECGCQGQIRLKLINEKENKDNREKIVKKWSFKDKVLSHVNLMLTRWKYSPFRNGEKNSLFIFQDPVVYNPTGRYYECPPTQSVVKHWDGKKTLFADYSTSLKKNAFPLQFPQTMFPIYPVIWPKIRNKIWRLCGYEKKIKEAILESFAPVLAKLEAKCGYSLNLEKKVTLIYRKFLFWKMCYRYYERLILRLKPQGVVEQCYYSPPYKLVFHEVAKKHHVPVIELQHGVMGREHTAYNSYITNNRTFPDYILLFSDFWKTCTRFPLSKEKLIHVGYPYLEEKILECKRKKKTQNIQERVLLAIAGDYDYGAALRQFLCDVCRYVRERKISGFRILYKMHPGSMSHYDDVCKEFFKYKDIIHVVGREEMNLYDCFEIADEQISIASTGIFEGMAYGLKSYIYNNSKNISYSFMEELCEKGYAKAVSKPEQLFKSENEAVEKKAESFWVENSKEVQIQAIKGILKKEKSGIGQSWN